MKAFYNGHEFRPAVEEILSKINAALSLRPINVVWCSIQTAAMTESGRVYLADVADDARLSHADLLRYVGMGAHELCHHAYTQWGIVSVAQENRLLGQLHNAVEDAYIERRAIREGLTGTIQAVFTSLVDGMVAEALREVTNWADPGQYPFALAVYLRDHASVKVPLADGLDPIFAEAAHQFKSCDSSADALRIAEWVMTQLKSLPKQPKQKPENKPGQGKGQQAPQKAAGDAQEGEGKGEGDPVPPGPARAPSDRQQFRDVEPTLKGETDGNGGSGGSYSEVDSLFPVTRHVAPSPLRDVKVQVPAALRYNLKRLFDNSSRTEFGLRRQSGAVDANALSRVGITDKVFKRRSETDGIDSAVVLVVDVSGSMLRGGVNTRIAAAVQCCAALLDTLDRAQVATAVLAFNHGTSMIKGFHARKTDAINNLCRLETSGGTNDFFAVRYAHKLLLARREQRKVCIVLTDGNGNPEETRRQVQAGESLGITTIGVGIQLDVSHVYAQHINVQDVTDLATASFKQIKLAV